MSEDLPLLDTTLADPLFAAAAPDDAPALQHMVGELERDVPPRLDALATRDGGDATAAKRELHQLRGVIGNFGLCRPAARLTALEMAWDSQPDAARREALGAAAAETRAGLRLLRETYPILRAEDAGARPAAAGAAPRPANDAARVAALHAYGILDTPPEPAFDELVRLAADLCDVPIAAVTLVDAERQWFKAQVGISTTEGPRDVSFCAHAICEPGRELFEVPDAEHDPRFAANPLVTGDPGIRFYAGTPLVDAEGWALGTLCVLDRKPRVLTEAQRRSLAVLRRFLGTALELRRMVARQQATIRELQATRAALETARQAAEDATRAKAQYVAAMSHELRTPMNAVIGMTTLLATTPLERTQAEYVETIRSSGEVLLAVVNDILDLAKLEAGKVELERRPFDVRAEINAAVALLAGEARRKGLALRTELGADAPAWMVGDRVRLRQIVLNLAANAVKFTDQGEVVVRSAGQRRPNGDVELEVCVTDTGIGITPEQMAKLFQEFGQADASTTRQYGGTGLGLVISKRFAELHGGRMWVESTPSRGSKFHFTIVGAPAQPAAHAASSGTTDLSAAFAARHPARILVAEDNPVNQQVIAQLLQKLGYSAVLVGNGREALALLQQRPFDVVLMDVEMPEMDGLEATRRLRTAVAADQQPVVVALTAHVFLDQRARFAEVGMDSYIAKPIRVPELTAELARACARRKSRA